MNYRLFTPSDDAVIIAGYATRTLHAIAAELGRKYESIQGRAARLVAQGKLDVHTRYYHRPWSEADEEDLADHWGRRSDSTVSQQLERSPWALKVHATRMGLARKQNIWSASDVGRLFGVDRKTVTGWVKRGWLRGRRAGYRQGSYRVWNFDVAPTPFADRNPSAPSTVENFVRTMGWAYDFRRMTEGEYLTNLAKEIDKADPWLYVDDCARLSGFCAETIRRWSREGLPHQHRPKHTAQGPQNGYIVVRRSDLLAFVAGRRRMKHWRAA